MVKQLYFPSQFVGKWTNSAGVKLKILYAFDLDDSVLQKFFVEEVLFNSLGLRSICKKGSDFFSVQIEEDSEDRETFVSIQKLGEIVMTKQFDKPDPAV